MFFIIKFLFYFSISFFILGISFNGRTIFDSLYKISAPYHKVIAKKIKENIKLDSLSTYFSSSKKAESLSSRDIRSIHKTMQKKIDNFTDEEKFLLESTIKKYTK